VACVLQRPRGHHSGDIGVVFSIAVEQFRQAGAGQFIVGREPITLQPRGPARTGKTSIVR
jgi:hypothetical protein